MNLSQLMDVIWNALRGRLNGGWDYVVVYTTLGAVLWAFLLFKAFLQEGIQIASGNHTELHRILIKYLFVAGMFAAWPIASDQIFNAVKILATNFFPSLQSLTTAFMDQTSIMDQAMNSNNNSQGLVSTILGTLYNVTLGSLLFGIGAIVLFICYGIILVCIGGSLCVLAMNLVLGPVFFAMAFDREFRPHALRWFMAVLSYFMLIPLYGAALNIGVAILAVAAANPFGTATSGQVAAQLLGPVLSLGIVLSTNKIINALVGGAAGAGLGQITLGIAGTAATIIPGGAMLRATGTAGGSAIKAASSATKTVTTKLSSTAKAAITNIRK
jgi:hypothetical protein